MAFVAHVVTEDTGSPTTPPQIAVTESDDRTGVEEPIISYSLPHGARVCDAVRLLQASGWTLHGAHCYMEPGYWIIQVRVADWPQIVAAVSATREVAEIQRQCCEAAWRSVNERARREPSAARIAIELPR